MKDPIIRMTDTIRRVFNLQMAHKRDEFEQELRSKILAYLNKLIERKKLQPEYNKVLQSHLDLKQKQIDQVTNLTSQTTALTGNSNAAAAANIAITAGSTLTTEALHTQVESLKISAAEEQRQTAQMFMYLNQDPGIIAERVASILSYRFQFLILRLAGGNDGYILLAKFMGKAIESYALEKLRGHTNKIDALVDAAIPQTDSLHYTGWFNIRNGTPYKTLEIDTKINTMIRSVGPAVRSLLGKPETRNNYQIIEVLNYPFIINGDGKILSGTQAKHEKNWQFDGSNNLPSLLLAPNEDPSQLGSNRGTYVIDLLLEEEQVIALNRLTPTFFTDHINHSIEIIKSSPLVDPAEKKENPCNLVYPEEKNECPWSDHREQLWKERKKEIIKAGTTLKKSKKNSIGIDMAGIIRQKSADTFDAKHAKYDLDNALHETKIAFYEISKPSKNEQERNIKKEKGARAAYSVVLTTQKLIHVASKLERNSSDLSLRTSYLEESKEALRTANDLLEATRGSGLAELESSQTMQKKCDLLKLIMEEWTHYIDFTHQILSKVVMTADELNMPTLIKGFVFWQKWREYDLAKSLIKQAEQDEAALLTLVKQTHIMEAYAKESIDNCDEDILINNEQAMEAINVVGEEKKEEEKTSETSPRLAPFVSFRQNPTMNIKPIIDTILTFQDKERVETYNVDKKLLQIESYKNDIEKTYHAIFSFLKIDTLKNKKTYFQDKEVTLSSKNIQMATQASEALSASQNAFDSALKNKETALIKYTFRTHRRTARQVITHNELTIELARKKIIECLSELESDYKEQQVINFDAARISTFNRNFKFLMKQLFPDNLKISTPPLLENKLISLDKVAKQFDYKISKESTLKVSSIYQAACQSINALGSSPFTLNQAFQYAHIARHAKEEAIHAQVGDIAATTSLASQAKSLQHIILTLISDTNTVTQNIHNLSTISISSVSGCSKHINFVDHSGIVSDRLNNLIYKLESSVQKSAFLSQKSLGRKSSLQNVTELEDLIYTKIVTMIQLKAEEDDYEFLLEKVINKLKKEKLPIELEQRSLNWGVWAVSITARTLLKYYRPQDSNMRLSELNSPLSLLIMQTKQLIFNVYQTLNQVNEFDESKKCEQTLTSNQACTRNTLKWAGELNYEEQQWRERQPQQNDSTRNVLLKKMLTNHVSVPSLPIKTNKPLRLLRHQLTTYSTLAIDKRRNLMAQFQEALTRLDRYRHDIEFENMTVQTKKGKNVETLDLISTIEKKLKRKIIRLEQLKNELTLFKNQLLEDKQTLRIYFSDWKNGFSKPTENTLLLNLMPSDRKKNSSSTLLETDTIQINDIESEYKEVDSLNIEDIHRLINELDEKISENSVDNDLAQEQDVFTRNPVSPREIRVSSALEKPYPDSAKRSGRADSLFFSPITPRARRFEEVTTVNKLAQDDMNIFSRGF